MLLRFASALCVASPGVALAVAAVHVALPLGPERLHILTSIWCVVPALWGLWAMLAPRSWVPGRLPAWGALLGVIVGGIAVFLLDVPGRVFGVAAPPPLRAALVIAAAPFYSVLWMIVRVVYRALARASARG